MKMNLIDAQTYANGPNGTVVRLALSAGLFHVESAVVGLAQIAQSEREQLETGVRKAAKKAQAKLPAPKYTGLQKIIDFDGMPLSAGV